MNGCFQNKYLVHIIGIGYVGLPLTLLFSSKYRVIAYDQSESRVSELRNLYDRNNEFTPEEIESENIIFTANLTRSILPSIFIITVPTPIDKTKKPDLRSIKQATSLVGSILRKGDIVIFESTVYPRCTKEICIPLLESNSNLKLNKDFFVGYSPERINPGDKHRTVDKIDKLVSSSSVGSLEIIHELYSSVISAPVHKTSSIEIAEAAKVIENIQRDVNIALMNEFSLIFKKLGLNTKEILDAASTKWNFLNFKPGLVGGHCIGVDPYYLISKSVELDYIPELIVAARKINDKMTLYTANEIMRSISTFDQKNREIKILFLGYTFKKNVADVRNSKIIEVISILQDYGFQVSIFDPHINQKHEDLEIPLSHSQLFMDTFKDIKFHCVVVGVDHDIFKEIYPKIVENHLLKGGVVIDLQNTGMIENLAFSL